MKATYITIEIGYNMECIFVTYKNISVYSALNKVKKEYKDSIVYSVKAEY